MTDLELVTQSVKTVYLKLSLMDTDYWERDQLQGELIELSLTVSADSDIRRVSTVVLHVEDTEKLAANYFGIWMDRMVQLHYGIYDPDTNDIRWWLLGSFLLTASSYTFDTSNRQLSLSVADMMAAATEERGSQIGYGVKYPAGSSIKNSLQATVARFSPYKKYDICEFEDVVPYDIEGSMDSYPIALLKTMENLFPWYEQFYSKDGVYTVRRIPTTMGEPCVMTADELAQVVIRESGSTAARPVKNCTEIWGKDIDANYTAKSCANSNGVYTLHIHDTYEVYENGALIAFTPDANSIAGHKMRVGKLDTYDIVVEAGNGEQRPVAADEIVAGVLYVVKYFQQKFVLQGESSIHVMCMEYTKMPSEIEIQGLKQFHGCENIQFVIEPDSPFACDVIGVVKQTLFGGEYSNIYTTALAYERANYENWKSTRLQDDLTLETLYIPWLDVNQKVEYQSIATGVRHQYLIREINVSPMTGTMTLRMTRFFPLYKANVICGEVGCGQTNCGG